MPGPSWAWVAGALGVFLLAAVLAFSVNGGGDDAESAVAAASESDQGAAELEEPGEPSGEQSSGAGGPVDDGAPEQGTPEEPAAQEQPAVATEPAPEPELDGFIVPIGGACITEFEGHFPGSPREYRNGTHEGLDFYGWASCRTIDSNTAVLAAKAGTVIRVDQLYQEITLAEFEEATDPSVATLHPDQREIYLDRLRGRQVWIDHGAGVVTRYAHLSAVAAGLQVGDEVRAGFPVGFVGESGQLEAITAPGTDLHLHFEIRVEDGYLGEGLSPLEARDLYVEAFGFVVE